MNSTTLGVPYRIKNESYASANGLAPRNSVAGNVFPKYAHQPSKSSEEAFLKAFDEYADALYSHAAFRLSNTDRALDLTQDTYIKAWNYLSTGKNVTHWKSLLYKILNNLIIDEYRRKKSVSLDALLEMDPGGASAFLATDGRKEKEDEFDRDLLCEEVRVLVEKLPEVYRTALLLRYVDCFTPKEIGHLLGTTENLASVRVHRAIVQLRKWCAYHSAVS